MPASLALPLALLLLCVILLYAGVGAKLVYDWYDLPDFSHGFIVPLFSAFLLWERRRNIAATPIQPSWAAIPLVLLGLLMLLTGRFGADLFLSRLSFLLLLCGTVWTVAGLRMLRILLFPIGVLLLAIPLPAVVFNQLTFPLQMLASRVASAMLPLAGVPVLREGNVINLPAMQLEVAEACSGIRSMMSLFTVAVFFGYLFEKGTLRRILLALCSLPIAVAANALRIFGTRPVRTVLGSRQSHGLLPRVFRLAYVSGLAVLPLLHPPRYPAHRPWQQNPSACMKYPKIWTIVALLLLTLALIKLRGDTDRTPPSKPLAQLPAQLNGWTGQDIAIPQESLDILGKGVFLNRVYQSAQNHQVATVGLFIGYFPTQRSGQSIHSPQNCLPGAGWNFDSSGTTELNDVHGPDRVGEYLISNGSMRQEVLYWYRSHGSNIANDYAAKFHMLRDSILYGRTDAALIRVITPVIPGEPVSAAHDRAVLFTQQLLPLLPAYIPN